MSDAFTHGAVDEVRRSVAVQLSFGNDDRQPQQRLTASHLVATGQALFHDDPKGVEDGVMTNSPTADMQKQQQPMHSSAASTTVAVPQSPTYRSSAASTDCGGVVTSSPNDSKVGLTSTVTDRNTALPSPSPRRVLPAAAAPVAQPSLDTRAEGVAVAAAEGGDADDDDVVDVTDEVEASRSLIAPESAEQAKDSAPANDRVPASSAAANAGVEPRPQRKRHAEQQEKQGAAAAAGAATSGPSSRDTSDDRSSQQQHPQRAANQSRPAVVSSSSTVRPTTLRNSRTAAAGAPTEAHDSDSPPKKKLRADGVARPVTQSNTTHQSSLPLPPNADGAGTMMSTATLQQQQYCCVSDDSPTAARSEPLPQCLPVAMAAPQVPSAALPSKQTTAVPPAATGGSTTMPQHHQWRQPTLTFGLSNEGVLREQLQERQQQLEEATSQKHILERELERVRRTFSGAEAAIAECTARNARYEEVLSQVMREAARTSRTEARRAMHQRYFELGHVVQMTTSSGVKEMWVEGQRMKQLMVQVEEVNARRVVVEENKKNAERGIKELQRTRDTTSSSKTAKDAPTTPYVQQSTCSFAPAESTFFDRDGLETSNNVAQQAPQSSHAQDWQMALVDLEEQLQVCKSELSALDGILQSLRAQQEAVDAEKTSFVKEIRRIQEEDQSPYASRAAIGPCDEVATGNEGGANQPPASSYVSQMPAALVSPTNGAGGASGTTTAADGANNNSGRNPAERYVLMSLLGKGGFSEVWRAFDVVAARYVACKIHHIAAHWSHATRSHFVKRADRELEIMRKLDHPRLTKLYDVFTLDPNTMVSVLEYSAGTDLDVHLKKYRTMREADARVVMVQLVSALRHLAEQEQPIIHYDLKPANILFHDSIESSLDIKLTDFGLSKIVSNPAAAADPTIELTSQGTGTYWYLPPECFEKASHTGAGGPRISHKVDIWAAGVIFYQMLFGKKPFAHGESQRNIWQRGLIAAEAAKEIDFPQMKPPVSDGAKELIRKCLQYRPEDRPDIVALSNDAYFKPPARTKRGGLGRATLAAPAGSAAPIDTMAPPAPVNR